MRTKLVSIEAAAEQLAVCKRTVRRLISEGQLPAYRVGETRILRVDPADVEKLLRRIPTATASRR